MKRAFAMAALAGAAGLIAFAATAAPLPSGPWACTKTAASAGPTADQDKGSGASEPWPNTCGSSTPAATP